MLDNEPARFNPDGTLTRAGALAAARDVHGPLGTISSDEQLPFLVWKIGSFKETIGRGDTWEKALNASLKNTQFSEAYAGEQKSHE